MIDRRLFRSEEEFERFKNSRAWEPTLIDPPPDGNVQGAFYVTPEMPTTFDFNRHLEGARENVRYIPGTGDFQRGEVANIRTAAEANMIRASVEGRMNVRVRRTVKAVSNLFERSLECLRWAVRNPDVSMIDVASLHAQTQSDVDVFTFRQDLLDESFKFRLLPFSPLMEDKIARRTALERLLPVMSGTPVAENLNWRELTREIQDAYGMRPSIVTQDAPLPPAPPGGMPGMPGMPPGMPGMPPEMMPPGAMPGMPPGMPGGAPPGLPAGLDPAMLAQLLGGLAGPQ
jgi:hypothetical protein